MTIRPSDDPRFDMRIPAPRLPSYAPGTVLRVSPIIPPPVATESTLPHEAAEEPDTSGLPHEVDGGP